MLPSEWAQYTSTSRSHLGGSDDAGIEDPELRLARSIQNFEHVVDAVICFGNSFDARPDLAPFGNEVVVGVDHQQRDDALVVCRGIHGGACSVQGVGA